MVDRMSVDEGADTTAIAWRCTPSCMNLPRKNAFVHDEGDDFVPFRRLSRVIESVHVEQQSCRSLQQAGARNLVDSRAEGQFQGSSSRLRE